ncbi:MAG TPA: hypothetical protein VG737_05240 [Cyclobacteriaceae bacterium]|nr:hypothetical protein [Cyclobacteriaceae bacterium]
MLLIRFLLLAMNAVAVGFLIARILKVYDSNMSVQRKWVMIAGGVILLLLPVTMIFGFIKPTPGYLVMYPVGIFFFIYMFRIPEVR